LRRPATDQRPVTPPHALLRGHYAHENERPQYVRALFDEAAPHYDWINRMMSLGSGEAYRRLALRRAGLRPGMRLLDIASGTGLVLRPASAIVGPTGLAVGIDPSLGMLRQSPAAQPVLLVQARGESLPLVSSAFDFVSLGYGLRHVADLDALFHECYRVLRPRGRLLVLEFSRPRSRIGLGLTRFYLKSIVPLVTRLVTRSPSAEKIMRYCWDTVEHFVPPETVRETELRAGFVDVEQRGILGALCEFSATKPA